MALIAGPVQFALAGLVAQSAWHTPYSWAGNAVSDLGAVRCQNTGIDNPPSRYVCSPWHGAFNGSAIVLGVLIIAGVVLAGQLWGRGAVSRASRALLVAAGAGMVLAGLEPEDVDLNLHVLGALLIFAAGSTGVALAGFCHRDSPVGRLRATTLSLGSVSVIATWLMFGHRTPLLGPGGMERVALYTVLSWAAIIGVRSLIANARGVGKSPDSPRVESIGQPTV